MKYGQCAYLSNPNPPKTDIQAVKNMLYDGIKNTKRKYKIKLGKIRWYVTLDYELFDPASGKMEIGSLVGWEAIVK